MADTKDSAEGQPAPGAADETTARPGAGPGEAATSTQTAQAGDRDQAEGDRTGQ